MSDKDNMPTGVGSSASLGLLPETDVQRMDGKDQWGCDAYSQAYSAEAMTAYAAQEVAAERERWEGPVRALLAAHDASLERIGREMRARGMATLYLPGEAQAEFDAVAALRELVGPDVRANLTLTAQRKDDDN